MKKSPVTKVIFLFVMLIAVALTGCSSTKVTKAEKVALVFDTDAGTDDATAILMLKHLNIKPDYMVATGGNASAEGAIRNLEILKKYLSLETSIVRGYEIALSSEKNTFHGEDGFANISEQMIKDYGITKENLADYISLENFKDKLRGYDRIEYIVVGPLSTLSYLCDDEEISPKLGNIYLMGGGINEFNCSHNTEFNFSKNPAAVKNVLTSGKDITLFPLDLTNHQITTAAQINELKTTGNLKEYISLLEYNKKSNIEFNNIDGAVLHDTMPVFYYYNPKWFETKTLSITSDEYGSLKEDPNGNKIKVVFKVEETLLNSKLKEAFGM